MNHTKDIKYIHQFVKNRKGDLVGCVAATYAGKVGWSLCNTKAGDEFNKQTALKIAVGRAHINPVADLTQVPNSVRKAVYYMNSRSVRYFKA
jgi:hypothetical protein